MPELKLTQEDCNIVNLFNGAIVERFDREINAVLNNIADINTGAGKRKIKITVEFMPDKSREGFAMACKMESTLAAAEIIQSHGFISKRKDGVRGFVNDPKQLSLLREDSASEAAQ